MERSNSSSSNDATSTPNTRSTSSVNPFAYQTRLLERTASLSRSNSLSSRFPPLPNAPISPVTRKWNPSHRLSASTDSMRLKWEERIKAEHTGDNHTPVASAIPQASNNAETSTVSSTPIGANSSSSINSRPRLRSVERPSVEPEQRQNSAQYRTPPTLKRHSISITPDRTCPSNLPQDSSRNSLRDTHRSSTSLASLSSVSLETSSRPGFVNDKVTHFSRHLSTDSITSPIDIISDADASHSSKSATILSEPSNITPVRTLPRPPPFSKQGNTDGRPISQQVMSPAPFRSSYMNNRKSNTYGLGSGYRLGKHLPRIASGDGNDISDKIDESKTEEEELAKQQVERMRERQERRRKWDADHGRTKLEESSPIKVAYNESESFVPSSTGLSNPDDVQGLRGRRKLLKSNTTPKYVTPLPTSRLLGGGTWADTQRHLLQAYEYLCHVGEAQQWIEGCLNEELGFGVVEMEEGLRNGVVLAKLVRALDGDAYVRRIYEVNDVSIK